MKKTGTYFVQMKVWLIAFLLTVITGSGAGISLYAASGDSKEADTVRKTIPYTLPWFVIN
ncbi:MAG: hypothetical protein ABFS38_22235 [Bacteroidota bacterium]